MVGIAIPAGIRGACPIAALVCRIHDHAGYRLQSSAASRCSIGARTIEAVESLYSFRADCDAKKRKLLNAKRGTKNAPPRVTAEVMLLPVLYPPGVAIMDKMHALLFAGLAATAMFAGQARATPVSGFSPIPPPGWVFNLAGRSVPMNPGRYVQYTATFTAWQATTNITFALTDSTFDYFFLDNIGVADVDNPGVNLIRNGGFEDGVAPSGGNPYAPVDWQYLNPYGVYDQGFVSDGLGQGGSSHAWAPDSAPVYDFITQPIATVIGDRYQLSFWALGPDEGNRWREMNGNNDWPLIEGDSFDIIAYAGDIPRPTPALPEPAALGMFGFGVLLIGGFLALRLRTDARRSISAS